MLSEMCTRDQNAKQFLCLNFSLPRLSSRVASESLAFARLLELELHKVNKNESEIDNDLLFSYILFCFPLQQISGKV